MEYLSKSVQEFLVLEKQKHTILVFYINKEKAWIFCNFLRFLSLTIAMFVFSFKIDERIFKIFIIFSIGTQLKTISLKF